MHELKKVIEAKYFYSIMIQEQMNREKFAYNLSAFLSSARSVLHYALKEAKTKQKGQQWYDKIISANPVLKFFKDKRDIDIHTEPIRPNARFTATLTESIHISDSVSITVKDRNGNIKQQYSPDGPETKLSKPVTAVVTKVSYRFNDWVGSEDVLALCQKYIQQLENVIKDGISKGFITG